MSNKGITFFHFFWSTLYICTYVIYSSKEQNILKIIFFVCSTENFTPFWRSFRIYIYIYNKYLWKKRLLFNPNSLGILVGAWVWGAENGRAETFALLCTIRVKGYYLCRSFGLTWEGSWDSWADWGDTLTENGSSKNWSWKMHKRYIKCNANLYTTIRERGLLKPALNKNGNFSTFLRSNWAKKLTFPINLWGCLS